MLGGFYLAGFFKVTVFEKAPDRSGVIKGIHLLFALGLWFFGGVLMQPAMVLLGMDGKSTTAQSLTYMAMFGGPLA